MLQVTGYRSCSAHLAEMQAKGWKTSRAATVKSAAQPPTFTDIMPSKKINKALLQVFSPQKWHTVLSFSGIRSQLELFFTCSNPVIFNVLTDQVLQQKRENSQCSALIQVVKTSQN